MSLPTPDPDSADPDSEFVSLLTEHQTVLRLYVTSLLPGEFASADIVQQANATIWRKRGEFQIGTNFKAWIFSIARYEVLNFRKRKARDSRLVFSDELDEMIADELPAQNDDMEDRLSALRSCLRKLKPADRELIRHRYFHGTPLKEYSLTIGRSVGSLKVTLHRIRTRLQQCLEHQLSPRKSIDP